MISNTNSSPPANRYLALVILLGVGLRLFQLGKDGFWFDEVGVAVAVQSPDPLAMTSAIRAHVAAMPLDYWAVWLFNRFCQAETCLRLPSAIWGTLALAAAYFLFLRFAGKPTAVLAVLLLAVSPLAVGYSQELRFYAALLFFYTAASALLLRAIETNRLAHWVQFILTTITGFYFHVYVVLAFLNGFIWLLFRRRAGGATGPRWKSFFASMFLVGAAAIPGYLAFRPAANYGMFSAIEALLGVWIGFGWFPNFTNFGFAALIWYALCFILQVTGIGLAFKSNDQPMRSAVWMVLAQAGLILMFNVVANYAMRGRQLLFLQPFVCLIMAYALVQAAERIPRARASQLPWLRSVSPLFLVLVTVLAVASILALSGYYASEKSRRRELAAELAARWQPGDEIWFTPAWESKFYQYYLESLGHTRLIASLKGQEQIAQVSTGEDTAPQCWVTPKQLNPAQQTILRESGFVLVDLDAENVPDVQLLWCR